MGNTITKERQITEGREFTFDPKEHVYTLDGKRMYGTTTILSVVAKPALIGWAANCVANYIKDNAILAADTLGVKAWIVTEEELENARTSHTKKKEKAGEEGTVAHEEIESIIKNAIEYGDGRIVSGESLNKQVQKFIDWAVDNNVKFLESEKRMYSTEWWVAGTADFICEINDKLYVGDVKTSRDIYKEYWYQTAAYAKMAVEMGLYPKFDGLLIVNVPKQGGLKVKENYDIEGNTKRFEAALTIYKDHD